MEKSSVKIIQDSDALVQQSTDQASENDGPKYRIYYYLKKNPGLLAGVGSALVLALSAMVNFCSYAFEAAMLQYWKVDLVYMNISLPSRVNGTVATLTFVSVFVVCILILDMFTWNIRPLREKSAYLYGLKMLVKKDARRAKWETIKGRFLRRPYKADEEVELKEKKSQISRIANEIRLHEKNANYQMRRVIIVLWFFLLVSIYVWVSMGDISISGNTLTMIVSSAVMSIAVLVPLCRQNRLSLADKRTERGKACEDYGNGSIQEDVPQFASPLQKVFSGQFEFRFSDGAFIRMLYRMAIIVVFYLFALVLIFQCFGYMKAYQQKQFMIVKGNNVDYAVIYNNGEDAILAEVREQGNNCVIDIESQRVVSTEGLVFEIREYDEVEYDTAQDVDYDELLKE